MGNYYFLAPSLPPLMLRNRPDITFEELKARLRVNLNKEDEQLAKTLMRFTDVNNIRNLLMEEPIDSRGSMTEKELDEALLIRSGLPDYVFDFLDQFEKTQERIRNFSALSAQFFQEEIPRQKGFLKRYFTFEREWRLVLVGIRSKQLGRDLTKELQFEDLNDPFVAQILAQRDADRYEPPTEYQELRELIQASYPDAWEQHKAFAAYRFQKVEEIAEGSIFSIDVVLAYMVRLMIVEQYHELDEEKGHMILETFMRK
jgi:predicted transport protein